MAAAEFVDHNKWGDIVGVKESKLARAIQAGNTQLLSQKIRENHLFQLCIAFAHFSTAFALVASGVPGRRVDVENLRRFEASSCLYLDVLMPLIY